MSTEKLAAAKALESQILSMQNIVVRVGSYQLKLSEPLEACKPDLRTAGDSMRTMLKAAHASAYLVYDNELSLLEANLAALFAPEQPKGFSELDVVTMCHTVGIDCLPLLPEELAGEPRFTRFELHTVVKLYLHGQRTNLIVTDPARFAAHVRRNDFDGMCWTVYAVQDDEPSLPVCEFALYSTAADVLDRLNEML